MAAPPPPSAPLPKVRPPAAPKKMASGSGIVAKAQNSLSWRTSKAALHSFALQVQDCEIVLECKPMTGESETATGTTVWDCSIVSTKYFEQYCKSLPEGYWNGKNVLEVGSGTGVAGLACAVLFQGSNLILSDLPVLTPLIRRNLESNRARLGSKLNENTTVQDFTWGTKPELTPPPPYDYIIVSDCVWPKIDNSMLVQALRQVTNLETLIILIYEFRHESCRTTFFEHAKQFFDFDCISEKQPMDFCPDDIEIYHIRRKASDFPLVE